MTAFVPNEVVYNGQLVEYLGEQVIYGSSASSSSSSSSSFSSSSFSSSSSSLSSLSSSSSASYYPAKPRSYGWVIG